MPLQGPVSGVEEIIALTFPAITEQYTAIQRSRNALEWDDVQAEAGHGSTSWQRDLSALAIGAK